MPKANSFALVTAANITDADWVVILRSGNDPARITVPEARQLLGLIGTDTVSAYYQVGATKELKIQAAIDYAVLNSKDRVFVPTSMLPYNAAAITFHSTVQMVREGGSFDVYDLRAYGATGNGVVDDRPALNAAASLGMPATGGNVYIPPGTFKLGSDLTTPAYSALTFGQGGVIDRATGVTLTVLGPVVASLTQFIFSGLGPVILAGAAASPCSVWWFGTVGDGFADDAPAIQRAVNAIEAVRGTVYFPIGRFRPATSIQVPSYITFQGAGSGGTFIDNQAGTTMLSPQLVNKDPANFLYFTMRGISCRAGTYAMDINVTTELAGLVFDDVNFLIQTAGGFRTNQLLQTSSWTDCSFYYCTTGVTCSAWTANLNIFTNCEFVGLTGKSINFLGASANNNFITCRFETAGVVGGTVINLEAAADFTLRNCWFERTHTKLISETGSKNGVTFDNCTIIGAHDGVGGLTAHTWTSDGTIHFGRNTWEVANAGPPKTFIAGPNGTPFGGKANSIAFQNTKQHRKLVASTLTPAANATIDLVTFARDNTGGAATSNLQQVLGRLWINYYAFQNGGFDVYYLREYLVRVWTASTGVAISIAATQIVTIEGARGSTLTLQTKAGASDTAAVLQLVFAGEGTIDVSGTAVLLNWSWEDLSASPTAAHFITATVP